MRISDWSSDVCSSDLSTFSAKNAVLFQNANGTSTKPASVVSLNSMSVTNSCTASTKKLRITTTQAMNSTVTVSRLKNTSGNPDSSPMRSIIGRPAKSEEHTSELTPLMRTRYDVFC